MYDNIKVEEQLLSEEQKHNNERTLEESLFKSVNNGQMALKYH